MEPRGTDYISEQTPSSSPAPWPSSHTNACGRLSRLCQRPNFGSRKNSGTCGEEGHSFSRAVGRCQREKGFLTSGERSERTPLSYLRCTTNRPWQHHQEPTEQTIWLRRNPGHFLSLVCTFQRQSTHLECTMPRTWSLRVRTGVLATGPKAIVSSDIEVNVFKAIYATAPKDPVLKSTTGYKRVLGKSPNRTGEGFNL